MFIHRCRLTLHDNVFYETRAAGRLYETEKYIHNYALTYALGLVRQFDADGYETIGSPYFVTARAPTYATDLTRLNGEVYVTPARPVNVHFAFHTFKYASNHYHDLSTVSNDQKKLLGLGGDTNKPSYGRAKELAVGSEFECFVIAARNMQSSLPHWIRLGLWMSKVNIDVSAPYELEPKATKGTPTVVSIPMNPLDIGEPIKVFDLISMPPVSLIINTRFEGMYYEVDEITRIPAGLAYRFSGG